MMKATQMEPAWRTEQLALTRYIPWLLQALLLLTVVPYLSLNKMLHFSVTKESLLFGALFLLFVVAAKAAQQRVVTALVCADTVVVSALFLSLSPGQAFVPYPYFVILMVALLGQNVRHTVVSTIVVCLGYFGVVYQHHLLTQQYLMLVPVMMTMTALVTCHVFRSERLGTHAKWIQQHVAVDALTGLPNRAAFIDRVWYSMEYAGRFTDEVFAVLFIDLDGFKAVNDQQGHRAGDELLRGMAERLSWVLRKGDVLSRYGGDEFCILLTRVHSKAEARRIAERILEKVKIPMVVGQGRAVTVGASIGIALSSNIHTRPEDLIRDADAAMYQVKQRGKNGIAISDQVADFSSPTSSFALSRPLSQS